MKKLFVALFTVVCSLSMIMVSQTNITKAFTEVADVKKTTVTGAGIPVSIFPLISLYGNIQ